jgi:hypothetical protein
LTAGVYGAVKAEFGAAAAYSSGASNDEVEGRLTDAAGGAVFNAAFGSVVARRLEGAWRGRTTVTEYANQLAAPARSALNSARELISRVEFGVTPGGPGAMAGLPTIRLRAPTARGHLPEAAKWIRKGGKVSYHADGSVTYTDADGNSVRYSPEGNPDFAEAGLVRQSVEIRQKGNYTTDPADADAAAPLGPKLPENTWHHHENLTTMQEIDRVIHNRFSHRGGVSGRKE